MTKETEKSPLSKEKPSAWWQPAVLMFVRMSVWIVAPVLLGTLLGSWLDKRFGTEPWLFVSTVGLAFFISMFGLVKNVIIEYKKIEKEINSKNSKTGNK